MALQNKRKLAPYLSITCPLKLVNPLINWALIDVPIRSDSDWQTAIARKFHTIFSLQLQPAIKSVWTRERSQGVYGEPWLVFDGVWECIRSFCTYSVMYSWYFIWLHIGTIIIYFGVKREEKGRRYGCRNRLQFNKKKKLFSPNNCTYILFNFLSRDKGTVKLH